MSNKFYEMVHLVLIMWINWCIVQQLKVMHGNHWLTIAVYLMMKLVVDMVRKCVLRLVLAVENAQYLKMVISTLEFFTIRISLIFQMIILDHNRTTIVLVSPYFLLFFCIVHLHCIRSCYYCIRIFTFFAAFFACSLTRHIK